jgi:AbiTii
MNGKAVPDSRQDLEAHKLALARELLDDIELSRLNIEQLLLKTFRLARVLEDAEAKDWLMFELHGYFDSPKCIPYLDKFMRWKDRKKNQAFTGPLAGLCAQSTMMETEIKQLRIPDVNLSLSSVNPVERVSGLGGSNVARASAPVNTIMVRLQRLTSEVASIRTIQAVVTASIHPFVVINYYRLAFSNVAQSLFRNYQLDIDLLLQRTASDVLSKIPSITARLTESAPEDISQAMNSCRRMMDAFVGAVQPASDEEVDLGGKKCQITADKVLNRLEFYLDKNCPHPERRSRLNKNARAIWSRVSTAVHSDVTANEARALFLQTYLTLGEILDAAKGTVPPI